MWYWLLCSPVDTVTGLCSPVDTVTRRTFQMIQGPDCAVQLIDCLKKRRTEGDCSKLRNEVRLDLQLRWALHVECTGITEGKAPLGKTRV